MNKPVISLLQQIDEAVRAFRRRGHEIKRVFVCAGGPRKGKTVSKLTACFKRRKPLKTRLKLRRAARRTKAQRTVKTKLGLRKAAHFKLVRLNKAIRKR
jgi:ribosomal protein L30/L7E